eukprot:4215067-Prorocentrum_lima.AAC.1
MWTRQDNRPRLRWTTPPKSAGQSRTKVVLLSDSCHDMSHRPTVGPCQAANQLRIHKSPNLASQIPDI